MSLDVNLIRKDFPELDQFIHGYPLSYLDSGASALKPALSSTPCRDSWKRIMQTFTVAFMN